ncbi:MAG: right-handed parallel beta-helix repeat-containing protein [Flavobacteriales bacterium]
MRTISTLVLLMSAAGLSATTYHVANGGSNGNTGLSLGQAWATPQRGANVAVAGDSVLVHAGSYQGFAAMDNSGTATNPIVFMGMGGVVNITSPCSYNNLDGINVEGVNWIVIEGFTVNDMPRTGIRTALTDHVTIRYNRCDSNFKWGILTGFAEHVIIEHNTCSNSEDEHGIYFGNSADDPIIRFNHCYGNNANGIHMNGDVSLGGDGTISNAQVYGNVIHGNGTAGGSGINCDGVINSVIYNNLLYDNHASGVSLYQIDGGAPSTGNKVYNNTIINASDSRWCVNITDGCTGNQVLNNILINQHAWHGSIVVAADALAGFASDHNLVVESLSPDGDATVLDLSGWQALGYDLNSQVADAQTMLFVDPIGGDFHPLDNSAQMVDAGTAAVSVIVPVDQDGTVRPQGSAYDIGCFEGDFITALMGRETRDAGLLWTGEALIVQHEGAGWVRIVDALGRVRLYQAVRDGAAIEPPRGYCIAQLLALDGAVLSTRQLVAL